VNLHAVEAGFDRAVHRITKLGDHHLHFFCSQRLRLSGTVARCGDGARCDRGFTADQRRFNHTAAVINLQNRFGALRLDGVGDFRQTGDFVVAVDTERAWKRRATVINKAALDNHGTDAAGAHAIIFDKVTGNTAIVITGTGGHRCHNQSVFKHRTFR